MMRSLYAGVSGLQNHQTRMDVIGNNIANVNTIGFKKGRVTFQDMISQTLQGTSSPTDELGGVNSKQVGLGMSIAAIDTIHTQGSLQSTGVATDVALDGSGFFVLRSGEKEFYSRAGAFGIDEQGTLVNPANGMRVQGWMGEIVEGQTFVNTSSDPGNLVIPVGSKDPAFATTEVMLACNLDKRLPEIPADGTAAQVLEGTWGVDKTIYDSYGNKHVMSIDFTKLPGEANRWQGQIVVDRDAEIGTNTTLDLGAEGNVGNTFIVQFSNAGLVMSVEDEQGDVINEGNLQIPISFDVADSTLAEGEVAVRQTFNLNFGEVGSTVNTVTQFAEKNSTKAFKQDGYTMGYLESFNIDSSGFISGVYSNGSNRTIGQIALASFVNPGGLEKAGDSTFMGTNNSGEPDISTAGVAGKGNFVTGTLEMSNVDLSEQFTDMIVTQRGFQANSKTIQTTDQMLQELMTLKR